MSCPFLSKDLLVNMFTLQIQLIFLIYRYQLLMIRLMAHSSQNLEPITKIKPLSPTLLKSKNRSPSVQIKLGQRCRRLATLQTEGNSKLNHSIQVAKTESIKTSYYDQGMPRMRKIETYGIQKKVKRLNLQQGEQRSCSQSSRSDNSIFLKGLSSCFGESPSKRVKQQQKTKRQIVKLKHRKTKSYSPIEKLLKLIAACQDPQETGSQKQIIF